MAAFAWATGKPLKAPEFTSTPSPTTASSNGVSALSPGAAMTRRMGKPKRVANSKSRRSCPGTAMIAPVP